MTILQLLRILWAHRWVELGILTGILAIVATVNVLLPKQYTATASIFVDVRSPDPIAGMVLPAVASSVYLTTQVDLVKSERVARAVTSALKLEQRAPIRTKWLNATDGKIALDAWTVEFLQKNLRVKPAQESSVIDIAFSADSADFAAEVANAFVQAYLAVNLELKLEPARVYATWFEEQTRLVRERLEHAQKSLSDFQQQAGVVASDGRMDFESARLNELALQLTQLQAELTDSQNKRNAPKANSTAEVMKSSVVSTLKIDIARLDAKRREAGELLMPDHPQILRMRQELATLKSQLAKEIKLIAASIETIYQVGKQRESDLLRAIDEQKARVLSLNKQRDELNVYKRDVESAQRAFEAVSQRAEQTRLESLSTQTNVVSLSAAKPPTRPSQPKLALSMLIAACVGTMLAVAAALLREMLNRRIRSHEDLELIGVPVLASISAGRPLVGDGARQNRIQSSLETMRKVAFDG